MPSESAFLGSMANVAGVSEELDNLPAVRQRLRDYHKLIVAAPTQDSNEDDDDDNHYNGVKPSVATLAYNEQQLMPWIARVARHPCRSPPKVFETINKTLENKTQILTFLLLCS